MCARESTPEVAWSGVECATVDLGSRIQRGCKGAAEMHQVVEEASKVARGRPNAIDGTRTPDEVGRIGLRVTQLMRRRRRMRTVDESVRPTRDVAWMSCLHRSPPSISSTQPLEIGHRLVRSTSGE
jgi:hypothetical protein